MKFKPESTDCSPKHRRKHLEANSEPAQRSVRTPEEKEVTREAPPPPGLLLASHDGPNMRKALGSGDRKEVPVVGDLSKVQARGRDFVWTFPSTSGPGSSTDGAEPAAPLREVSLQSSTHAFSISDVMSVDESARLPDQERLSAFCWNAGGNALLFIFDRSTFEANAHTCVLYKRCKGKLSVRDYGLERAGSLEEAEQEQLSDVHGGLHAR